MNLKILNLNHKICCLFWSRSDHFVVSYEAWKGCRKLEICKGWLKNPICCSLKIYKPFFVKKILVSGLGIWSNEHVICLFRGYKETKKQTNYKTWRGCLTEKNRSTYTKIEKNNWVLSCIIYLWMKNKQKIQFATPKDYWIQRFLMSSSSHIQGVLIGVKYRNCRRTLDVYLLFAILLGQIKLKLNYRLVTYKLTSPSVTNTLTSLISVQSLIMCR